MQSVLGSNGKYKEGHWALDEKSPCHNKSERVVAAFLLCLRFTVHPCLLLLHSAHMIGQVGKLMRLFQEVVLPNSHVSQNNEN
jgi:hypothetical protein